MKGAGAIRQKLKQVRWRHLKARIEERLRQAPGNCRYNGTVEHVNGDDPVHICMYGASDPATWRAVVCDSRHGGDALAEKCPLFVHCKSKDEIKAEFRAELASMTLPQIAFHYPDLAALTWVLDGDPVDDDDDEVGTVPPTPASVPEPVPSPPAAVIQLALPLPVVGSPAKATFLGWLRTVFSWSF